jgi:hypothetical protein
MKTDDMVRLCADAVNRGDPFIPLVIPRGRYPRRFPRGDLLCVNADGQRVYAFSAVKLLAWCVANGFAKIANPAAPRGHEGSE